MKVVEVEELGNVTESVMYIPVPKETLSLDGNEFKLFLGDIRVTIHDGDKAISKWAEYMPWQGDIQNLTNAVESEYDDLVSVMVGTHSAEWRPGAVEVSLTQLKALGHTHILILEDDDVEEMIYQLLGNFSAQAKRAIKRIQDVTYSKTWIDPF